MWPPDFYDRGRPTVYGRCYRRQRRRGESESEAAEHADDATQEGAIKTEKVPATKPPDFDFFLAVWTRNAYWALITAYRKRLREREKLGEVQPMDGSEPGDSFDELVEGLTEREIYLLKRRYVDGATLKEIADELGCSVSTVYREISEALEKLAFALERTC